MSPLLLDHEERVCSPRSDLDVVGWDHLDLVVTVGVHLWPCAGPEDEDGGRPTPRPSRLHLLSSCHHPASSQRHQLHHAITMDPLGPHSPVPSDAASLTAPIVLLLLALSSAAYLSHTLRATPIALPTSSSDGLQPDSSSEKVKQVDVEISPSSFYPHQRVRKLLFVGAAVGCEAVALFELARSASRGEGGWESSALMTAFYVSHAPGEMLGDWETGRCVRRSWCL